MSCSHQYMDYEFIAFWSKEVIELIRELKKVHAKNSTTQHDLALRFVNDRLFEGKGTLIKGKPIKDQKYSDLKVFLNATRNSITIEFKLRTGVLKYLQEELRDKEDLFSRNDYLYFSYFLQRKSKDKTKILKIHDCAYYLIITTFSKVVQGLNLKLLMNKTKQDAKDYIFYDINGLHLMELWETQFCIYNKNTDARTTKIVPCRENNEGLN